MIKKIFAFMLAVILLLSLTACGGKNSAGQEISAAAEKKDTVVIAIGDEPETLDPTKGWGCLAIHEARQSNARNKIC